MNIKSNASVCECQTLGGVSECLHNSNKIMKSALKSIIFHFIFHSETFILQKEEEELRKRSHKNQNVCQISIF